MDFREAMELFSSITALIGIVAVIGLPFLWWHGKKLFAEVGQVVAPAELERRLSQAAELRDERLQAMEHSIRDAVNSSIGRESMASMQRHDQLSDDIREIKEGMKESLKKSDRAIEMAKDASHKAELATAKVDANRELVVARLEHIERSVDTLARRRKEDFQ